MDAGLSAADRAQMAARVLRREYEALQDQRVLQLEYGDDYDDQVRRTDS